jgi:hypothetical protein
MASTRPQTAPKPDSSTIPVQLRTAEFEHFILPPLSLPKRGPQCKIGYHKPFNYILKVLYTGMQWKELPIEKGAEDKAELYSTGIFKLFARWAEDGSPERAFIASVNISPTPKSYTSLCSTATAPTPWPKKGGHHKLQRPQTPEGRESDRAGGQPRLRLVAPDGGAGQ